MKISKKIKGYAVVKPEDTTKIVPAAEAPESAPSVPMAEIIQMHEKVERPASDMQQHAVVFQESKHWGTAGTAQRRWTQPCDCRLARAVKRSAPCAETDEVWLVTSQAFAHIALINTAHNIMHSMKPCEQSSGTARLGEAAAE